MTILGKTLKCGATTLARCLRMSILMTGLSFPEMLCWMMQFNTNPIILYYQYISIYNFYIYNICKSLYKII